MKKMTYRKWRRIGSICGYDGTRTASSEGKDANRLKEACPYETWKKIGNMLSDKLRHTASWLTEDEQRELEDLKSREDLNAYEKDRKEFLQSQLGKANEVSDDRWPVRIGEAREFLKEWCQEKDPGGAYTDEQRKREGIPPMESDSELVGYVASLLGFRAGEEDPSAFINPDDVVRQ